MGEYKRKRKRSNVQIVKRLARKGFSGRGKSLDKEHYDYFVRIFQDFKSSEGEERDLLIRNLFEEILKMENIKDLVSNQLVSKILDDILPFTSIESILGLMSKLSEDLRTYCLDQFASHVLESLLSLGFRYTQVNNNTVELKFEPTEDQRAELEAFLVKVSKFVSNNLGLFINQMYASHVVKTVIEICSGVEIKASIKSSQKIHLQHGIIKKPSEVLEVPSSLEKVLPDIINRLMKLPNLPELICNEASSTILQSSLLVASACNKQTELIKYFISDGFTELDKNSNTNLETLHPLFGYNAAIRLLEVAISVASTKRQRSIFSTFFKGKIHLIIENKIANFALQKLLMHWKDRDMFVEIYEEVIKSLEKAYDSNYTGVIYLLVQACKRLQVSQAKVKQAIMELLNCWEPQSSQSEIVPLLLFWTKLEDFEENKPFENSYPISLHGSLIIQEFLHFNRPSKVAKSIYSMSLPQLEMMACNPNGSHVIDALVNSPHVNKNKHKLISGLQGGFAHLACSKNGSRSLEAIWAKIGLEEKTVICQELLKSEKKMLDNFFGQIIHRKFQLNLFKLKNKLDWEQLQLQEEEKLKKLETFIISDKNDANPEKTEKSAKRSKNDSNSKKKRKKDDV